MPLPSRAGVAIGPKTLGAVASEAESGVFGALNALRERNNFV